MKALKYNIWIALLALAAACGTSTEEVTVEEGAHEHEAEENQVHLKQNQIDVMGIELGSFQYLNLSTTIKTNGRLELPPQNKASLSPVMSGRVKSVKVLAGDYVNRGQTLATLEHPDFIELQEDYISAQSNLIYLKQDFLRKKQLYKDSISSAKSLQEAEAAYRSADAKFSSLREKLRILDINLATVEAGNFVSAIPIKAPINGYVKLVDVNIGKSVHPDDKMFEIVDNDHIHIDLIVYEKDMARVQNGQKVIFSLTNNPDSVFEGSIFSVGKSFDEESKAMYVHAEINNKKGNLLPGMYVDARIITNNEKVKALPNDAIVSDGGLNYIFALEPKRSNTHTHEDGTSHTHEDDNHNHADELVFRRIETGIGAQDIGFTEVAPEYNLPDHIQFVTKGAFYLLAEMKKGEGGHGHSHGHHH